MDRVLDAWLEAQLVDLNEFAGQTDLVEVTPVGPELPYRKFIAEFGCTGLVRQQNGAITEHEGFAVAICFGEEHLRRLEPLSLVWLLAPQNTWHPNIGRAVCPGHVRPGVGLIDVLYQVHSILTYQNFNLRVGDYLNPEAQAWAREHRDMFPIDSRPLKRKVTALAGDAS